MKLSPSMLSRHRLRRGLALLWLGLGYVIGWSTTLMIGRWRERRKHHRLRV